MREGDKKEKCGIIILGRVNWHLMPLNSLYEIKFIGHGRHLRRHLSAYRWLELLNYYYFFFSKRFQPTCSADALLSNFSCPLVYSQFCHLLSQLIFWCSDLLNIHLVWSYLTAVSKTMFPNWKRTDVLLIQLFITFYHNYSLKRDIWPK